jgi:5,10-methylenetetrahydromethanopterin reductase
VQGYLRGEEVSLGGGASRIRWAQAARQPKVPVVVVASGPHVIALAARHAEGVDFTVGSEPARLRWATETARAAAPGHEISLGAFLNVAVHPDRALARDLVRGSAAIFARFATEGAPPEGLSDVTRAGIERLAADYDERRHGQAAAAHARQLEDEFIDRFALVGPAEEVVERLAELAALGIQRIVVVPRLPGRGSGPRRGHERPLRGRGAAPPGRPRLTCASRLGGRARAVRPRCEQRGCGGPGRNSRCLRCPVMIDGAGRRRRPAPHGGGARPALAACSRGRDHAA